MTTAELEWRLNFQKNVLDEDGQADELTDAEQHDSVFLLEGPIWTSLSMEEKKKYNKELA